VSGVVFRQSPDAPLEAAKVDEKQGARRANAPVRARPPVRADEPVFQPPGPRAVFDDPPEPWVTGELPETFEADARTRAKWEVETLGFPVSLHPLECFGPRVAWKNYITVARLTERQREFYGKTVRVCGLIVADRRHPTAQGAMKFLTLADWTGFVEVSLFARTYREYGHLTVRPVVSVEATVDAHDNRKGFSLSGVRVGAVE
jgi:DNA polymerase III alpha subunit